MDKNTKNDILKTTRLYLFGCDSYMGANNKYSEKLKLYISEIDHLENVLRYSTARICTSKHILKSEWSYDRYEFALDDEMLSDLIDIIYTRLNKFCNEEVEPILNMFNDNDNTKSNI